MTLKGEGREFEDIACTIRSLLLSSRDSRPLDSSSRDPDAPVRKALLLVRRDFEGMLLSAFMYYPF
jgi:hypothetical protein